MGKYCAVKLIGKSVILVAALAPMRREMSILAIVTPVVLAVLSIGVVAAGLNIEPPLKDVSPLFKEEHAEVFVVETVKIVVLAAAAK